MSYPDTFIDWLTVGRSEKGTLADLSKRTAKRPKLPSEKGPLTEIADDIKTTTDPKPKPVKHNWAADPGDKDYRAPDKPKFDAGAKPPVAAAPAKPTQTPEQAAGGHWVTHEGRHLFIDDKTGLELTNHGSSPDRTPEAPKPPARDYDPQVPKEMVAHAPAVAKAAREIANEHKRLADDPGTGYDAAAVHKKRAGWAKEFADAMESKDIIIAARKFTMMHEQDQANVEFASMRKYLEDLQAQTRAKERGNPNHVPAGTPEGGQFTSGPGGAVAVFSPLSEAIIHQRARAYARNDQTAIAELRNLDEAIAKNDLATAADLVHGLPLYYRNALRAHLPATLKETSMSHFDEFVGMMFVGRSEKAAKKPLVVQEAAEPLPVAPIVSVAKKEGMTLREYRALKEAKP